MRASELGRAVLWALGWLLTDLLACAMLKDPFVCYCLSLAVLTLSVYFLSGLTMLAMTVFHLFMVEAVSFTVPGFFSDTTLAWLAVGLFSLCARLMDREKVAWKRHFLWPGISVIIALAVTLLPLR